MVKTKNMSVALVSSSIPKNFLNPYYSFVFDEAYRLTKEGLDIHAITSFAEKESVSCGIHFYGLNEIFPIKLIPFSLKHFGSILKHSYRLPPMTLFSITKYAQTVAKVTCQKNLNLIHAHFAYPEGLVGLLAKKETGRPLIVTVHGVDVLVEPSIGYGLRLNKKVDRIVRQVLDNADAVVAASRATFNELFNIVTEKEKINFIPNGVDTKKFNPNLNCEQLKNKYKTSNKVVIFTLRSHELVYGLEYFIKAASIVAKQRNDVLFVLGGDGSLRHYHEKLAAELGLGENVRFTGRIPHNEVPNYYCLSDIVIVPSLQEAFGLAVSEAMACCKPVIGSNVGGIPDQIIDRYNGFLIPPRNPFNIAEKILWLIDNPEKAKNMGINARQSVLQKYDIEKRTDEILGLYRKILKKDQRKNSIRQ